MRHCRFCDADFVSGTPCKEIEQRDRCGEWAAAKMAECDYRNGRQALGEDINGDVGSPSVDK